MVKEIQEIPKRIEKKFILSDAILVLKHAKKYMQYLYLYLYCKSNSFM